MGPRLTKLTFDYGDKVRVYPPDHEFYDHLGEVKLVEPMKVWVVLNIHKTKRTAFKPSELECYDDPRKDSHVQYTSLETIKWGGS